MNIAIVFVVILAAGAAFYYFFFMRTRLTSSESKKDTSMEMGQMNISDQNPLEEVRGEDMGMKQIEESEGAIVSPPSSSDEPKM